MKLTLQQQVWGICNKLKPEIKHININFFNYYGIYDPRNTGKITDSIFTNILRNSLKRFIHLNNEEIQLLVKYFEDTDGQIKYREFCKMVHDETNLNRAITIDNTFNYTTKDLGRLNAMKKITNTLNAFNINSLLPYFENYEKLTGIIGSITKNNFENILYDLKIHLSPTEINLVTNKWMVFGYKIDKDKCLKELDWVKMNDPQSLFTETNVKSTEHYTRQYHNTNVFHPAIENKTVKNDNVVTIIRHIQRRVLEKRINISQFFEQYDKSRKGYVTINQFHGCLDMIGVGSIHGLHYSEQELGQLVFMFRDKLHTDRIKWTKFVDEINSVFFEKKPKDISDIQVNCSRNNNEMIRIKGQDWEAVDINLKKLFVKAMTNIKNRLTERRIFIEQFFKDYDKNNHGHVTRSRFRRTLYTAGIQNTEEELNIIEKRFININGFNYIEFLNMLYDIDKNIKKCTTNHQKNDQNYLEISVIQPEIMSISKLMNAIKTTVKRKNIDIYQFLNQFDVFHRKVIPKHNFNQGLQMAGIIIEPCNLEILLNEFESKTDKDQMDYCRFCDMIEEAFVTLGMEKTPTVTPTNFLPTYEDFGNYLSNEQQSAIESALIKLRSKPHLALEDIFKDYDKLNQGHVSVWNFFNVISIRKLNAFLTEYEIKCLTKAFKKSNYPNSFNYRLFIKDIENT